MKLLSGNLGWERTKGLLFQSEPLTMLHESVNNLGFAFTKPLLGVRSHLVEILLPRRARAHTRLMLGRRRNKTTRSARAFHI